MQRKNSWVFTPSCSYSTSGYLIGLLARIVVLSFIVTGSCRTGRLISIFGVKGHFWLYLAMLMSYQTDTCLQRSSHQDKFDDILYVAVGCVFCAVWPHDTKYLKSPFLFGMIQLSAPLDIHIFEIFRIHIFVNASHFLVFHFLRYVIFYLNFVILSSGAKWFMIIMIPAACLFIIYYS